MPLLSGFLKGTPRKKAFDFYFSLEGLDPSTSIAVSLTFTPGTNINIGKDGAALVAPSSAPVESPAASGVYKLVLTATEMDAAIIAVKITHASAKQAMFYIYTEDIHDYVDATVVSNAGNTATTFQTDLTETTTDHWANGPFVQMTSGLLSGQVRKITAYDGTTKFLTVTTAFTGTPAAGDTIRIVNQ